MTREEKEHYEETDNLRRIIEEGLRGKKFRLDCGHYAENIVMRTEVSQV